MATKKKSTVRADIKKNRLYITIAAPVNKTALEKVYTDVRFCVADLQPGFDVITDLSQCTIGHLSGVAIFRKIMSFLVASKVGRVIRIVGEMSVILKQLIGISSKFQCYKPIYVRTMAEAEEELNRPVKPRAIRFHIQQRQVELLIGDEKNTANLLDISTNGCALDQSTATVAQGQSLDVVVQLLNEQDQLVTFTLHAKVARTYAQGFAVEFVAMDEEQQALIYTCLAHEMKRDLR